LPKPAGWRKAPVGRWVSTKTKKNDTCYDQKIKRKGVPKRFARWGGPKGGLVGLAPERFCRKSWALGGRFMVFGSLGRTPPTKD